MALDGDKTGAAVAAIIQANAPTPGTPVTPAQLETMWKAIITKIYADIAADGVVNTVVTTPDTINGTGTGSMS